MTEVQQPNFEYVIDVQNEQVILGNALNFEEKRAVFLSILKYDHFLEKKNKIIAWCIFEMSRRDLEINDDSFILVLNDYPDYNRSYGGNTYLAKLRMLCPSQNNNFEFHVKKLIDDHVKSTIARNRIIDLFALSNNPIATTQEILSKIEVLQSEITQNRPLEVDFVHGGSLSKIYYEFYEKRLSGVGTFVSSGFEDLDQFFTEGFAPKNISIIAGFTGMAKSSFIHNMMMRQLSDGLTLGLVSIEMITASVMDRFISIATGIPSIKIIKETKNLTDEEKECLKVVVDGLSNQNQLFINDRSVVNLESIDAQLSLLERTGKKLDILYIDLFGKLDDVSVEDNLASNIEHKMRICRAIARKHNVHICCAVQIRRYFDMNAIKPNRPIPRPKLDKLKNSNSFAEEADLVLLLHRNKYYKNDLRDDILEIEIAKQRQGIANKVVYFEFDSPCTRIFSTNLKPDDYTDGMEG